jgi:peptidoglycan/LPS O-acetylase OafA/YrhL
MCLLFVAGTPPIHCTSSTCRAGIWWNVALQYLCFPSLLAALSTRPPRQLACVVACCALISVLLPLAWMAALGPEIGMKLSFFLHVFAPFRALHFVIGVATALAIRSTPLPRPVLLTEACSAVLLLNLAGCALYTALPAPVDGGRWIAYQGLAEFSLPALHALWLAGLTTPGAHGPTRRLLSARPLRWLGGVSYCVYCLHIPLLSWCAWAAAGKGISFEAVPWLSGARYLDGWHFFPRWAVLPLLAVVLLVAATAHYGVEVPARAALLAWAPATARGAMQTQPQDSSSSAAVLLGDGTWAAATPRRRARARVGGRADA